MIQIKKIFKSFIFYCVLLSFIEIFMHQIGQDSKRIVLIGFNPILDSLANSPYMLNFMNSGLQLACNDIVGSISIYWYIGSVITFVLYGMILDTIKYYIKRGKFSIYSYLAIILAIFVVNFILNSL